MIGKITYYCTLFSTERGVVVGIEYGIFVEKFDLLSDTIT